MGHKPERSRLPAQVHTCAPETFLDEHLQDALILVPSIHLSAPHPWGAGGQVY